MTLIVADPPWTYRDVNTGGGMMSGASAQYALLTLSQLSKLPVWSISSEPAYLALWATVPLGQDPYRLMARWGFDYKASIFWHKTGKRLGIGHYYRNHIEVLMLGVRGNTIPFRSNRRNVVEHPPLGHSQKPEVFQDILEEDGHRVGVTRFVELFARRQRPGWDCYGLELGHDFLEPRVWEIIAR